MITSTENLGQRTKMDRRCIFRTSGTTLSRARPPAALATILFLFVTAIFAMGYESTGSCNPRPSRRGRAELLAAIPCDLTVQAYCNLPGTAYPWNAVRRFVHENQGLMKRMYGDVRHISVLKNEFENNEIEVDDIELAAARYSRNGKNRAERKTKYNISDNLGRLNDVLTEPHFRPTTTPTTTEGKASKISTKSTTVSGSTPDEQNAYDSNERSTTMSYTDEIRNLKNKYEMFLNDELEKRKDESVESNSIYENTTEGHQLLPVSYNQEKLPDHSSNSTERSDPMEPVQISSTLKMVKVDAVDNIKNEDPIAYSTMRNVEPIDDLGDMIIVENEGGYRETSEYTKEQSLDLSTTEKLFNGPSKPLDRVDDFSGESSEIYTETKPAPDNVFGEEKHKTQLTQGHPQQTMMKGHLYQDAVQKNEQPVMMSGRGVNACPVKEEVVAPFWANNTRGEVLALLNLYPFEQYVHWEKCNEHKQMYCREGCRCEQQYRLHRLLAYDPHNECRGIFSDWFRFPSCCICKCYDIPNEFRVTSRSPRSLRTPPHSTRNRMEEAEQNLHKAIYDHATEDWYRIRREDSQQPPASAWPEDDFNDLLDLN